MDDLKRESGANRNWIGYENSKKIHFERYILKFAEFKTAAK